MFARARRSDDRVRRTQINTPIPSTGTSITRKFMRSTAIIRFVRNKEKGKMVVAEGERERTVDVGSREKPRNTRRNLVALRTSRRNSVARNMRRE